MPKTAELGHLQLYSNEFQAERVPVLEAFTGNASTFCSTEGNYNLLGDCNLGTSGLD